MGSATVTRAFPGSQKTLLTCMRGYGDEDRKGPSGLDYAYVCAWPYRMRKLQRIAEAF